MDYSLHADILMEQGHLEQALNLLRDEVLPAYRRLGEIREQAITLSRIAEIRRQQGHWEEALHIHWDEALPLYKKVGDERELSAEMGNIAVILYQQRKLDEAIEILRKEVLPVAERLGDKLGLITDRANLAFCLLKQGYPEDRPEAHDLLCEALADAERMKLPSDIDRIQRIRQRFNLPPLVLKRAP